MSTTRCVNRLLINGIIARTRYYTVSIFMLQIAYASTYICIIDICTLVMHILKEMKVVIICPYCNVEKRASIKSEI